MKFYSINKIIEELKLLLEKEFKTLTVIMSGEDMYEDGYKHTQGTPCIIKVDDKVYKYRDLQKLFEDDITLGITLPRKFKKDYLACIIDVTKPQTSDKFDEEFYPRKFAKLSAATLKQAKEEQKFINTMAGLMEQEYTI